MISDIPLNRLDLHNAAVDYLNFIGEPIDIEHKLQRDQYIRTKGNLLPKHYERFSLIQLIKAELYIINASANHNFRLFGCSIIGERNHYWQINTQRVEFDDASNMILIYHSEGKLRGYGGTYRPHFLDQENWLFLDEQEFLKWLKNIGGKSSEKGRKYPYYYEEMKRLFFKKMDHFGSFDPSDKEWPNRAFAERFILQEIHNRYDEHRPTTTVRRWIRKWEDEYSERRRSE